MSTSPDTEFDLDLHFLPAWAQQPANKTLYTQFEGEGQQRDDRRRERRDRPPGARAPERRSGGGARPGGGGGPRPGGPRDRRDPRGGSREERRFDRPQPAPEPLPEIDLQFRPEEAGVDSLARQIKMTGRAYPLFGIAQLILEKPERHSVLFSTKKKPEGGVMQPLYVCALDDTLWLSEEEAVAYALDKYFSMFYQPERTETEPPKGTYTFVAQCGMSGTILGPPNYHDYQNQLRKLHAERFSRMPFDMFKARVKIVRDEAVVKKWIEDQSWKTEYICLNVPEPLKVASREDVEKHFRQTHLQAIIQQVDSHEIPGVPSRSMPCRALQRLVRVRWEDQKRFPLQVATLLSQQFASRGLQFFKVNRTVTHVAVARPHHLDVETNPVSETVKRIVDFISARPKCTRRQLFEALAPSAVATVQPVEGGAPAELTPEASAIISDLHWLIHQGHVIEFANGVMETAKKPVLKPVKPEPAPQPPAETAAPPGELATSEPAAPAPPADATAESPAAEENIAVPEPAPGEAAEPAPAAPAEVPPAEPSGSLGTPQVSDDEQKPVA